MNYFTVRQNSAWLFWGRALEGDIAGATWHIDSVGAAASFHLQLKGRKGWAFRLNCKEVSAMAEEGDLVVFANDMIEHATWLPQSETESVSVEFQLLRTPSVCACAPPLLSRVPGQVARIFARRK